jgi:metal-responsive CopG/Arc/MetJ family transcriptional regulator
MSMKNIQITVDEETLRQVDRVSGPLGLKRSEVVRQALRQWLQRRATERFEEEWISALRTAPDDRKRADDWLGAQIWSRR